MPDVDARIERLIVRRLDGELSDPEQAELDRAILRDPHVRALLEEYERIDSAASAALVEALDGGVRPPARSARIAAQPARRGYGRMWWLLPVAAAAAVAVLVSLRPQVESGPSLVRAPSYSVNGATLPRVAPSLEGGIRSPVHQASHGWDALTADVDRLTDRDVLYVVGPDGNVYILEQERVQTTRTPKYPVRLASSDY